LAAILVAACLTVLGCGKDDKKPVENVLHPWDLPIADVPEVVPGQLNTVFEDRDGVVWLGTANGVVRYDPANGSWRVFSSFDGLPLGAVNLIHQDRDGTLWFALYNALVAYDAENNIWKRYDQQGAYFFAFIEDPENGFWVFGSGLQGPVHFTHQGNGRSSLVNIKGSCKNLGPVVLDRKGFFWTEEEADDKINLVRCDRSWNRTASYPSPATISKMFQDQTATLWIGTDNGLFLFDPSRRQMLRSEAPVPSERVLSIAEDQKGGLWIGFESEVW